MKTLKVGQKVSFFHNGRKQTGMIIEQRTESDGQAIKVETEMWMVDDDVMPVFDTVRLLMDTEKHKKGQAGVLMQNVKSAYLIKFEDGEEWLMPSAFEFLEIDGEVI